MTDRATDVRTDRAAPSAADVAAGARVPGTLPLGAAVARARAFLLLLTEQIPTLLDELGATGTAASRAAVRPPATAGTASLLADRDDRADRDTAQANLRAGLTGLARTRAPIRIHVSDTLRDITDGVTELEEAVCDRLRIRRPKRAATAETIRRLVRLLPRIDADPVLAEHVRDESRRMARRASRALGDDGPMLRLPGTCPHCDSVSLRHLPLDGAVWCVNPDCRCTTPDCGCASGAAPAHSWPDTAPPRPLKTLAGSRR